MPKRQSQQGEGRVGRREGKRGGAPMLSGRYLRRLWLQSSTRKFFICSIFGGSSNRVLFETSISSQERKPIVWNSAMTSSLLLCYYVTWAGAGVLLVRRLEVCCVQGWETWPFWVLRIQSEVEWVRCETHRTSARKHTSFKNMHSNTVTTLARVSDTTQLRSYLQSYQVLQRMLTVWWLRSPHLTSSLWNL